MEWAGHLNLSVLANLIVKKFSTFDAMYETYPVRIGVMQNFVL